MEGSRLYLFSWIAITIGITDGAKILGILAVPGKSPFNCNNAVMKSLLDAGHDVTFITSFPEDASKENYTYVIDAKIDELVKISQASFKDLANTDVYEMLGITMSIETQYCYKLINLKKIQEILNSKERLYDVILIEMLFVSQCFLPIAEKFDIPVIGVVTLRTWRNADHAIANPSNPSIIPYEMGDPLITKGFFERLRNTWNSIKHDSFMYFKANPTLKQFHQDNAKQLGSLAQYMEIKPALVFYNSHSSYLPKPMNPNAIEIGGIHIKEAKSLPEHIEKFIDEAKHGVILFTFGSIMRVASFPNGTLNAFKQAFSEIPQRVIWKFEEKMENVPENVMLLDWVPQRDILEHKNVKAFISHCGQGGTYEAIYTMTPMIACPLFADQAVTAGILEKLQVAVRLDINYITKESVSQTLNEIINDTRYYENMKKLHQVFKDRPMTPQQTVVYWTEYVIRHKGAPHLKTAASQLNWFQYFLLDILCAVISCFIVFVIFIYKVFQIIFNYFSGMNRRNNKSKLN